MDYFFRGVHLVENKDRFAARLRELRESAGLTQEALAIKAGLSRDGVAHLEQGRRSPSWKTVQALASALGVESGAFTTTPRTTTTRRKPGRPTKGRKKDGK